MAGIELGLMGGCLFVGGPILAWLARRFAKMSLGEQAPTFAGLPFAGLAISLVLGALLAAGVWKFGLGSSFILLMVLLVALMALSIVDLCSYRLPDRLVFGGLAVSVVVMIASWNLGALRLASLGMLVYCAMLLVMHLISPRGLGFGDVKFALLLGLHLGYSAGLADGGFGEVLWRIFLAQLLASFIGTVGGLALAIARRKTKRALLVDPQGHQTINTSIAAQSFPFGPALAIATLAVVLAG